MPNWGDVSKKLISQEDMLLHLQTEYLALMEQYTGRNVIAYYSAFMQKPGLASTAINDNDKIAFMQMVSQIEKKNRKNGLDLILHTPGGDIAATESLVYYLKQIFGRNIRVFVPQMAMSAGTMIALASKEIIMGKESSLGPIDPQYNGISCYGVVEEFQRAIKSVNENPASAVIWSNIIGKYHPTFLGDCEKAIDWGKSIVSTWLKDNMFLHYKDREDIVDKIVKHLSDHKVTFAHNRHIHMDELRSMRVKVRALESYPEDHKKDCKDLQDCVLTLHYIYMQTMSITNIVKIIQSDKGSMIARN